MRAILYEVKVRKRSFTSPTVVALGLLESLPEKQRAKTPNSSSGNPQPKSPLPITCRGQRRPHLFAGC